MDVGVRRQTITTPTTLTQKRLDLLVPERFKTVDCRGREEEWTDRKDTEKQTIVEIEQRT